MASPTEKLPIWATDATFTTGIESGATARLEPALVEKTQGVKPGRWVARKANWILGSLSDWVSYLAQGPLRSWRKELEYFQVSTTVLTLNPTQASISPGTWALCGYNLVADTGYVISYPCPQALLTISAAHVASLGANFIPTSVISNTGYIVVGILYTEAIGASLIRRVNKDTGAVSSITLTSSSQVATLVSGSGAFVFALGLGDGGWVNGGKFWISSNYGAAFTEYTISGVPAGPLNVGFAVTRADGTTLIALGGGEYIAQISSAGVHSTIALPSGAGGARGICDLGGGNWGVLCNSNFYKYWAVGTWTTVSATPYDVAPPHFNDSTGRCFGNMMASDGGRSICFVTSSLGYAGVGIARSQDYGETWAYDELTHPLSATIGSNVVSLSYANGEYLAVLGEPDTTDSAQTHFSIWRTARY